MLFILSIQISNYKIKIFSYFLENKFCKLLQTTVTTSRPRVCEKKNSPV